MNQEGQRATSLTYCVCLPGMSLHATAATTAVTAATTTTVSTTATADLDRHRTSGKDGGRGDGVAASPRSVGWRPFFAFPFRLKRPQTPLPWRGCRSWSVFPSVRSRNGNRQQEAKLPDLFARWPQTCKFLSPSYRFRHGWTSLTTAEATEAGGD